MRKSPNEEPARRHAGRLDGVENETGTGLSGNSQANVLQNALSALSYRE
jgi:hypothetical protein